MHKTIRNKNQFRVLESKICGLMIVCSFFGEHLKIRGLPLYVYPLIICVLLLLVDNHFRISVSRGIQFFRIETFAVVLILFSTIALPFAIGKVGTQPYFKLVVTALIILIVANNVRDVESFNQMLKYALIGVAITVATSGYEIITGHHFFAKTLTNERLYRMGRNNSFGFQININDNASLTALSLFIVALTMRWKNIICRSFSIALFIMLLGITVTINARLPLLAISVVVLELILLMITSKVMHGAVTKLIVGLCFVVVCILFFSTYSMTGILSMVSDNRNDAARLYFMIDAIKTISPFSFFFGHGCGITQELIGGDSIHSVLVEILCDNGIIPALCFVFLIIKLQFSFADRKTSFESLFFPCFATAFFLVSFCSSSMLRIRSIWVFFAVIYKYYSSGLFNDICEDSNNIRN